MFDLYFGGDRERVRNAVNGALEKEAKTGTRIVRITDAHTIVDLDASLQGAGLFDEHKTIVFDGLVGGENEALSTKFLAELPDLEKRKEKFYVVEGLLDAATRKMIEKYADKTEKFESAKKKEGSTIFTLANALRSGDKKALWIGYHRELQKGSAPEAIHGVLFWAAKEMFLSARDVAARTRAATLVSSLAVLPHEARRQGFDLEYALEDFTLSVAR